MLNDMRYAIRTLLRTPGFTFVAVLTLALGIGASTAIFSVVDGVLLRPLPYPEPDELVRVWHVGEEGGRGTMSYPNFEDVRERSRSFDALAAYSNARIVGTIDGKAEEVEFAFVTQDIFDVLGTRPALGREITEEEWQWAGAPVAIISHGFWQRRFGGSADALGAVVTFEDLPFTIVGVLPQGIEFPARTEVWVPRIPQEESRTAHNWHVVGRLRDGVALAAARDETRRIAARLKTSHGVDTWMVDVDVTPLHDAVVGQARPALLVLLGASGLLLLIGCANVVNLMLARATARQQDLAIRLALGAGPRRIVRQFLAESLVLSLAGGAAGVILAFWGVPALLALAPATLPRLEEVQVDGGALAFALGVAVISAVAMGLVTALRATADDVRESLAGSHRTTTGGGHRVRSALVASQVALTLVLLAGAGLLVRSFQQVLAVDPGYRTERTVVMDVSHAPASDAEAAVRRVAFYDELVDRLRALPGVMEVGMAMAVPLAEARGANGQFLIVDRPEDVTNFDEWNAFLRNPERLGEAEYRTASAEYFRAMGIPLLRGRLFEPHDGPDAPHVAVISESLARTRWPGEDPIGKLIQFGNMDGDLRVMTIVGVVGDVRERSIESEPRPTLYGNARQRTNAIGYGLGLVIRVDGDPASTIAAARRITQELDPGVLLKIRTYDEVVSASLAGRRFTIVLLGIFAVTALVIAAAGLYGVIAYVVARRTREIGIRMALGADPASVLRLVVGQGAALAGIGILIGIPAALATNQFLAGMLYGVGTADPVTFGAIALILAAVALVASWVPARRAVRVDPMIALRTE